MQTPRDIDYLEEKKKRKEDKEVLFFFVNQVIAM